MKYYIREKDSRIYVNADLRPRMDRIRLKKYLEKEIKCLEENQKLMERMISGYKKTDYDTINGELNDVYKGAFVPAAGVNWRNNIPLFTQSENPLYPEELIHTTSFGLKTRTKGEMEIAELLYKLGIPFRYEMRLELFDDDGKVKIVYPDFSIPLEDEWFFIEHLGLLNKEKYVKRNAKKLHEYHSNGILMPGQLIFTMDGPDGGLDAGPVIEFLQNILLPRLWKSEAGGLAAG
ncbi:MAG: hypothetical protein IKU09_03845 [Firmicutes bacterium]|nr:hypothetical protein [Bacillota bacterium]